MASCFIKRSGVIGVECRLTHEEHSVVATKNNVMTRTTTLRSVKLRSFLNVLKVDKQKYYVFLFAYDLERTSRASRISQYAFCSFVALYHCSVLLKNENPNLYYYLDPKIAALT